MTPRGVCEFEFGRAGMKFKPGDVARLSTGDWDMLVGRADRVAVVGTLQQLTFNR